MSARQPIHAILGAHGAVGRALTPLLRAQGVQVRQVARSARQATHGDTAVQADLRDPRAAADAVAGADVAYLLVGLQYDTAVWTAEWPVIMANCIAACAASGTRLVFLDNVYAYGRVDGVMTEDTPFNPCSRKGEVRARIATTLLDAMRAGSVQATIVRSPDFYSDGAAGTTAALLNRVVFDRLQAGKTPQWLGRTDVPYAATWVPDLARSLAFAGSSPAAVGHTWHALTSSETVTARDLIALAAQIVQRPAKIQNAPRWMVRLIGLAEPMMREQVEMLYQYEQPYRFSGARIADATGFAAVPYADAFRAALQPSAVRVA